MDAKEEGRVSLLDLGQTRLTLSGADFRLDPQAQVGRGGSCLVYHALKLEKNWSPRRVILKEFYPVEGCGRGWRNPDGSLTLPWEEEELAFKRSRFLQSRELLIRLHNEETLNRNIVDAQEYLEANGTMYMVIDYNSGKDLDRYLEEEEPSLFALFGLLRDLALTLGRLHSLGYLHMDLKPENVLCCGSSVKVIDTDSFVALEELGETGIIGFTQGYSAPEVWDCLQEPGNAFARFRLQESGQRTDVYSFGAIVHSCLFAQTPEPVRYDRRRGFLSDYDTTLEPVLRGLCPGLPGKAVELTRELLHRTLCHNPGKRFAAMEEIAKLLEELLVLTNPREPKLTDSFSPNPYPVVGREAQLRELREKLRSGGIVCVTGIGGVGKSTLARHYAETCRAEAGYDAVIEVSANSAAQAVQRIRILNWEPDPGTPALPQCVQMLTVLFRRCRTLLIVNNYDVSEDDSFHLWSELGCHVILTSRHDWKHAGIPTVTLRCADLSAEGAAEEIFTYHYLECAESKEDRDRLNRYLQREKEKLRELLSRLDHHPLGLKLTARLMSAVPTEEMLPSQALRMLDRVGFEKESPVRFVNRKDTQLRESNVYGHLSGIFHAALENGSLSREELETLRYMTLVSPAYGISPARFTEWTGIGSAYLERLRRHGWLEYLPQRQDLLEKETHRGFFAIPMSLQKLALQYTAGVMTVAPMVNGMLTMGKSALFRDDLTAMKRRYLLQLERNGWLEHLQRQTENPAERRGVYIMPLVVQEMLRKEPDMTCTTENSGEFFRRAAWMISCDTHEKKCALRDQQEILIRALSREQTEGYASLLLHSYLHGAAMNGTAADSEMEYLAEVMRLCRDNAFSPTLRGQYAYIRGIFHLRRREYEAARTCLQDALQLARAPEDLFLIRYAMSVLHWNTGKADKAVFLAERLMEEIEENKTLAVLYPAANVLLGTWLRKRGSFAESERCLRSTEDFCSEFIHRYSCTGVLLSDYIQGLLELGTLETEREEPEKAKAHLRTALRQAERYFGREHPQTGKILQALARVCSRTGETEQAAAYREHSLNILEKTGAEGETLWESRLLLALDRENTRQEVCRALGWYAGCCPEFRVEQPGDLWYFYFSRAAREMEGGNVCPGLDILERWMDIARKVCDRETLACHWDILARVYDAAGFPERQRYCLRHAGDAPPQNRDPFLERSLDRLLAAAKGS